MINPNKIKDRKINISEINGIMTRPESLVDVIIHKQRMNSQQKDNNAKRFKGINSKSLLNYYINQFCDIYSNKKIARHTKVFKLQTMLNELTINDILNSEEKAELNALFTTLLANLDKTNNYSVNG